MNMKYIAKIIIQIQIRYRTSSITWEQIVSIYSLKSTHNSVFYVYVLGSKNISLYMYSDLQVHISVWFIMRGMRFDQNTMISKKRGAVPN